MYILYRDLLCVQKDFKNQHRKRLFSNFSSDYILGLFFLLVVGYSMIDIRVKNKIELFLILESIIIILSKSVYINLQPIINNKPSKEIFIITCYLSS